VLSFAAIGHVTNDLLVSGIAPGGSVLYGALTAAGLGARAFVSTSHAPDFTGGPLLAAAGVTVENLAAAHTTTFEHVYDAHGNRHAAVRAIAARLERPIADADVVFCCPVIDEVAPAAIAGSLVGAGLQGWLRRLDGDGTVRPKPFDDVERFAPCRAVFASDEDFGDDAARLVAMLREVVPIVVVTHGVADAEIYAEGRKLHVPAYPALTVDATGAGDVFATAFLLALARGSDLAAAGAYAACAASIVVEGVGPSALSRLDELPARLDWYARNAGP
jgi:hypothetical protein